MMVALLLYGPCQGERSSRVSKSGACAMWATG